jgi:hypothetical protein
MIRPRRLVLPAVAALALAGGAFLALTSFAPGAWVATWAPCPRNWAWVPAWQPRKSPLNVLAVRMNDWHFKVCFGSPALRGRTMLGGEAVPYGKLWRTGANEPTTIHSDRPFALGPLTLAAGSHAIYTVPNAERWDIVVNASTRQWGLESEYTPEVASHEEGRFTVPVETLSTPIEAFTVRADTESPVPGEAELILEWQRSRVRLPMVGH